MRTFDRQNRSSFVQIQNIQSDSYYASSQKEQPTNEGVDMTDDLNVKADHLNSVRSLGSKLQHSDQIVNLNKDSCH